MMPTVTSEELWEKADYLQEWVEELREDPSDACLLQETAEEFGETLTTLHTMARQSW